MMECVRCGQCCISVGREFWLHGDFEGFPALAALAEKYEGQDDGLPCRMLQMKDGVASCKIELIFGRAAKPKVCRDYPALNCRYKTNDIARDFDDPKLRGWVLDDLSRPMDAYQIADYLEIRDREHFASAMDLLCDPEVGLVELADFGGIQGEKSGKMREAGESAGDYGGKEVGAFKNETETENEDKFKNETEKGETGGKAGESASRPPSVMVSGSVSQASASVSGSAPRAGGRHSLEDIRNMRHKALAMLISIIPPRTQGDSTTYRDIMDHIAGRMVNETDEDLFEMMLKKARQCKGHGLDNPRGAFVAAMKKSPFYYNPRGQVLIKGALDKYMGEKTR